MKVVIFCGGLGTRLREFSDTIPKPLVPIGTRPILWHLMKYYAHYGHKDFVLCLGYKGELIKEFFLNYDQHLSSDFVMERGEKRTLPPDSDISDWRIAFIDTGLHAKIGERLLAVRQQLEDEELFLVNYGDQLSDFPLDKHLARFERSDAIGAFAAVRPLHSFHCVEFGRNGLVRRLASPQEADLWINGGYMMFRRSLFEYMRPGEELVEQPFGRLIEAGALLGIKHDGFWMAMDTFKDKITFDRMDGRGERPWQVWR